MLEYKINQWVNWDISMC